MIRSLKTLLKAVLADILDGQKVKVELYGWGKSDCCGSSDFPFFLLFLSKPDFACKKIPNKLRQTIVRLLSKW